MKKSLRYLSLVICLFSSGSFAQQVTIGTGTMLSVFSPICMSRDYSVYEIIYLSTDINTSGIITHFAFERSDGSHTAPIQNVSLFMKTTTDNSLANSLYSEAGYQLVYQGAWPNDSGAGWREVMLSQPFSYDGTSNLQVLVLKHYEPAVANTPVAPRWIYTNISPSPDRARRYYGNIAVDSTTSLTSTEYSANARLTFGSVSVAELHPASVSAFPNPVMDDLSILLNSQEAEGSASFELYDLNGTMLKKEFFTGELRVTLEGLARGMYIYRIITGTGVHTVRLLKQ